MEVYSYRLNKRKELLFLITLPCPTERLLKIDHHGLWFSWPIGSSGRQNKEVQGIFLFCSLRSRCLGTRTVAWHIIGAHQMFLNDITISKDTQFVVLLQQRLRRNKQEITNPVTYLGLRIWSLPPSIGSSIEPPSSMKTTASFGGQLQLLCKGGTPMSCSIGSGVLTVSANPWTHKTLCIMWFPTRARAGCGLLQGNLPNPGSNPGHLLCLLHCLSGFLPPDLQMCRQM